MCFDGIILGDRIVAREEVELYFSYSVIYT
jgi:hypothetical protein